MDGWWNTTAEFEKFIQVYGYRVSQPWIYALRNPLILEKWENPEAMSNLWKGLKRLWVSGSTDRESCTPEMTCEVLMYCSSNKPSVQPAMLWLARRLGQAGVSTVHWGSDTITSFPEDTLNTKLTASGMHRALGSALRYMAVKDIPISFWHSVMAYGVALKKCKEFARRFKSSFCGCFPKLPPIVTGSESFVNFFLN